MAEQSNPTAYHLAGCPCGQPGKEMSVDEFLRTCFLKRLKQREDLSPARIGGSDVYVPRPRLSNIVGQRYAETNLARLHEPRNPLLCRQAHFTWSPGAPDLPRPMEINLGGNTLSRVKELLEDGERVPGAHFKHWRRNTEEIRAGLQCFCGQNAEIDPTLRARIRSSIYGARASSMVCFYPEMNEDIWSGNGTIGIHTLANADGADEGWLEIADRDSYNERQALTTHLSCLDQTDRPLVWLSSHNNSQLPLRAHHLIYPTPEGDAGLTLPDAAKIYVHFHTDLGGEMTGRLKDLREKLGTDAVRLFRNQNSLLQEFGGEDYYVSEIQWSDPNAYDHVKTFIKLITGLDGAAIRQSSALRMEIFDTQHNQITGIDGSDRTLYRGNEGQEVLIRIRRGRNKYIESFYLNLGDGIQLQGMAPLGSRVRITDQGSDAERSEHLYEIYLDVPLRSPLQRAIWLKLRLSDVDMTTNWLEIFDFGSSVETSGQRIRFTGRDAS